MRSYWSRVGTESKMTRVLIKRGNLDPDMHTGRVPHEDEGRDQGDASTNPGMPKIASKPPE